MQIEVLVIRPAKLATYLLLFTNLLIFSHPGFGQEYTAKDSASFKRILAANPSDLDRIDYQLRLAEYAIRKPGSFKADLDNAKIWIDMSKKINNHLKSKEAEGHILFEEVYLQQESGSTPQGKAMCEQAISLLKNGRDKNLLASAYKGLAYYYSINTIPDLNAKINLISQAVTAYRQCGNQFKTATTLQYLADLYHILPNYPAALKSVNESLAIFNSIHYPQTQGAYAVLASIYFLQDDFTNCLKYELVALKITERLKDSTMQACEINNHLGVFLMRLNQMEKAPAYFKTAQLIAKKNNDINTAFVLSSNLASCYYRLQKPGEALKTLDEITGIYKNSPSEPVKIRMDCVYVLALINLKQFDRAYLYAEQLLNSAKSPSIQPQTLDDIYSALTNYYFFTKNYSKERETLLEDQKIIDKWNVSSRKADILTSWYKMDSAQNDYKAAFLHFSRYKALTDSIFNEKKSKEIARLQVGYETQKKEDNIKFLTQNVKINWAQLKAAQLTIFNEEKNKEMLRLQAHYETQKKEDHIKLLTQNAQINQVQLKTAKLMGNVTLGGIAIIALIAGLLYKRYREKRRSALLITEKNTALQNLLIEKEWLLKEVHHRVKNNLQTVISLLESQAMYLENDALKAIDNSRHRIYAMSLIHQKLYQNDDIKVVNMNIYLAEFVQYLQESFGSPDHIRVTLDADNIKLGAGQAIPVSLIINEAVNNAFKYAFPTQKNGEIAIVLKKVADEIYLSVTDNGIGFELLVGQELNSLGLELIKGLTLDLRGTITFESGNGTCIRIRFMVEHIGVPADEEDLFILAS